MMSGHNTIPGREDRRRRLRPERDVNRPGTLRGLGATRHGMGPPSCLDARHPSVIPSRSLTTDSHDKHTLQRRFVSGKAAPALGFCEKQSTKCEVTGGRTDAAPATTATTATTDEKPDRAGNRLVHPAAGISQFQARTHQRRTPLAHQAAGGRTARPAQTHPHYVPPHTPFLKGYPL